MAIPTRTIQHWCRTGQRRIRSDRERQERRRGLLRLQPFAPPIDLLGLDAVALGRSNYVAAGQGFRHDSALFLRAPAATPDIGFTFHPSASTTAAGTAAGSTTKSWTPGCPGTRRPTPDEYKGTDVIDVLSD